MYGLKPIPFIVFPQRMSPTGISANSGEDLKIVATDQVQSPSVLIPYWAAC
jgi:hypothetical protein